MSDIQKTVTVDVVTKVSSQELDKLIQQLTLLKVQGDHLQIGQKNFSQPLKDAGEAAGKLRDILESSWNSALGQLDFTKVNNGIKTAFGSATNLKNALVEGGERGTAAFAQFNSVVLSTDMQLKSTSKILDRFATTFRNTVRYGIASSIFNNFSNSIQKAYNYTKNLDTSLNDIRIVTKKSAEDMDQFAVTANRASKELGKTTLDFTKASLIYYQQGLGDEEAQKRAEVTLKTANVTGQSTAEVSEQLTAVWNGYNVAVQDSEKYIDKLAAVAASTASDLEELSTGMGKVASSANTMGVDIDELAAQLATIVSVTRQAPESVGTALRTIYARMGDIEAGLDEETTLGNYTAQMKSLGVNVLDANGKLRDMGDVITEIGNNWQNLSREQQIALAQTMAGTRQYNNLLALFENWDMYNDALNTSQNSVGELQRQQDIYMESTEAHLNQLSAEWEKTYSLIFDQDSFRDFIDMVNDAVGVLNTYISALGGGMNALGTIGLNAAALFSKNIAGGISNAVLNFQKSQNTREANKTQQEMSQQWYDEDYSNLDAGQKARVDSLTSNYNKTSKVQGVLSEEQAKNLNDQSKELANLAEKIALEKQYIEEVQKEFKLTDKNSTVTEQLNSKLTDNKEKYKAAMRKQLALEEEINNAVKNEVSDGDDLLNLKEETNKVDEESLKKLENLKKETQRLSSEISKQEAAKEKLKGITEDTIEADERQYSNLQRSRDMEIAQLETTEKINVAIKGVATAWAVINSTQNVFSIITSDELDNWEKFQQILTILLTQLPMFLMNWQSVADLFNMITGWLTKKTTATTVDTAATEINSVITDKNTESTEKNTKAKNKNNSSKNGSVAAATEEIAATVAETGASEIHTVAVEKETLAMKIRNAVATLGATLVVGAVIAGVAALGSFILSLANTETEEEKLQKQLERTSEEVKKSNEELNNLKSTIDSYQNSRKNIDSLTEGTVEFYQAIIKSNEEAKKLIDSLGLISGLDYTINSQGLITIDEKSLQENLYKQIQETYRVQAEQTRTQILLSETTNNRIIRDFQKSVNNQIAQQKIDSKYNISEKRAREILENIDKENYKLSLETSYQDEKDFRNRRTDSRYYNPREQQVPSSDNRLYSPIVFTVDIEESVGKVLDEWKNNQAQIDNLKNQYTIQLLKGSITQEQDEFFSNLDSKVQDAFIKNASQIVWSRIPYSRNIEDYKEIANLSIEDFQSKFEDTFDDENSPINKYLKQQGYIIDGSDLINPQGKRLTEDEIEELAKNTNIGDVIEANLGKDIDIESIFTNIQNTINDFLKTEEASKLSETGRNFALEAIGRIKSGEDIKSATGKLTEEEFNAIKNYFQQPERLEDIKENPSSVWDYVKFQNFQFEGTQNLEARQADMLQDYNNELSLQAEKLETSETALKLYGNALRKAEKDTSDLSKETADSIAESYKFNKAYNNAADTLEDNKDAFDKYVKSLKSGEKVSYDVADGAAEVVDSLQEIFVGLDFTKKGFLEENADTIKKFLTGTEKEAEEAYKTLKKLEIQDVFKTTFGNLDDENQLAKLETTKDKINELQNAITNLEFGEVLDDNYTESLMNLVNNAQLTKDEVETLFKSMNLKVPPIDADDYQEPEVDWKDIPESVTRHTYEGTLPSVSLFGYGSGEDPNLDTAPITIKYAWEETTQESKQPYVRWTKDSIEQAKTGNQITGLGGGGNFTRSQPKSSGSKSKPKKKDPIKDVADRYHKVNTQIQKVDNSLSKLQSQQEKFTGGKLIDNLTSQWELLNTQIDNYNEKLRIAQGEQKELRDELSKQGVQFNADGTISNYMEAFQAQEDYVNGLIDQYNRLSEEQKDAWDESGKIDDAKEKFDEFKENMDRYDELVSDFIPGLEQSIQDAIDEQIDLQIEAFNYEIQLRLDWSEAERDWNEFKKRILDGIKEEDILGNARAKLEDFSTYYNEAATAQVQALTKHVNDLLDQLRQQDANNDWANAYGDDRKQALEDLKEYYDQLKDSLMEVLDLQEEIHDAYIDMIDEAAEKFGDQVEMYENVRDLIEHDMNVIELVYGEEAYGVLSSYYDRQEENYLKQIEFQRMQKDFWYAQMQTMEEGTEEWEAAKENWLDAVDQWNSAVEEAIENLQDKYLNTINEIFQKLNDEVTAGKGLDYVNEEWELINKNAERYLDTVDATWGIQKLENKYLDAYDQTDSITARRQIKKIMDEELDNLREQDKLSEYDLERANMRYDILLKQIALEEAQQNKTQMRLRRDSQGNYRYQFVADDSELGKLRDELGDLYNSLYDFDKEHYQENLNGLYDVWVEFQEKMAEAAQINDPEKRAERELLIREQYEPLLNSYLEENLDIRNNLNQSAFDDLAYLYDENAEDFRNMTEDQKQAILEELIPAWTSGMQQMADEMNKQGGFIPTVHDSLEDLNNATNEYEQSLEKLQETSDQSFGDIQEDIDETIGKTEDLLENNDDLIDEYKGQLDSMKEIIDQLNEMIEKYKEAEEQAKNAATAAHEYWSAATNKDANEAGEKVDSGALQQPTNPTTPSTSTSGSGSSKSSTTSGGGDGVLKVGDTATYTGKYYYDSYGTAPVGSIYSGVAGAVRITMLNNNSYGAHLASKDGKYPDLGWVKKSQLSGYDTGGYTGSWGKDGRLALLHEKELVLNADDTKNILDSVYILRNITNSLGTTMLNKLSDINSIRFNQGNYNSDTLEQNVHIDATFPNVQSAQEIENALNNLVNVAAMRIGRDKDR